MVEGTVHDSKDQTIAGVVLSRESTDPSRSLGKITDSRGHFKFEAVSAGTLRAKSGGIESEVKGIRPTELRVGRSNVR